MPQQGLPPQTVVKPEGKIHINAKVRENSDSYYPIISSYAQGPQIVENGQIIDPGTGYPMRNERPANCQISHGHIILLTLYNMKINAFMQLLIVLVVQ